MGATKRVAELIIQQQQARGRTVFAAVRFGNVLGSNGSVVSVFKRQIREGGPLTVTDKEITRYFMTIPEAVQLVLEAGSMARGGEIFVLDMGEPVKIYDLAVTMIKLSGLEPEKDIKIEVTGLRPGEKLYEEISLTEETVTKTSKDKIFVLKSSFDSEREEVEASFFKLREYIDNRDYAMAYNQIKVLIPSFDNNIAM
jgi:FlaA1/EpsC-like NDP-sugar epimerase